MERRIDLPRLLVDVRQTAHHRPDWIRFHGLRGLLEELEERRGGALVTTTPIVRFLDGLDERGLTGPGLEDESLRRLRTLLDVGHYDPRPGGALPSPFPYEDEDWDEPDWRIVEQVVWVLLAALTFGGYLGVMLANRWLRRRT